MNWMTVQQVAEYLQLSPMMIYKMAQLGKIPSVKIGRVWRLQKEAIDLWLQSKSENTEEPPFRKTAKAVLADFVSKTKMRWKDQLVQIVVFGSQARGDAVPESDIDVLVVFKEPFDYEMTQRELRELAYAVTFDQGRMIHLSVVLMNEGDFLTGNSPLLLNIRKEAKRAA